MTLPLIGITTFTPKLKSKSIAYACSSTYTRAITAAGGAPVLIPLGLDENTLWSIFDLLDGILLPGGGDIDPQIYGASHSDKASLVNQDRDRIELALTQRAQEAGKPFFGICRGFQVVNVAFGGNLYIDIAQEKPGAFKHDNSDEPRDFLAHPVRVEPGTRLAGILGSGEVDLSSVQVNSLHHQGVKDLAPGLVCSAVSTKDRLIEAIELPDHPFGVAVQWHPEELQAYEPMRRIFRAFVEAAEKN